MAEEDNAILIEEEETKTEEQAETQENTETQEQGNTNANGPAASSKMEDILARTGYSHEITAGQRKYGGPPPGWEGPPPAAGCEVYCGKVPNTVPEEELILLFEKCGTIWDLRLMLDPLTGQGRGFCFCTFTDKQGAQEAVKQLDGYSIRGPKKLKVNVSIPNCRLFLGNIPKSKTKDDIFEEISKATEGLVDVIIYTVPDDPRKKNRGFAFLDYDSHKSASNGRKRLGSGRVRVFNCDVIVDWADPLDEPDTETMSKVKVLYVRNLKADVTEDQLRETFGEYGSIEKVKKVKDYGFVHYVERESALQALAALDGTSINDSVMLVSLAKPPTDAKLKEQRKLQHQQLFNNGRGPMDNFYGGGGGRGMMGGRGRAMRSSMGGRGMGGGGPVAFRGMNQGYDQDYWGGGGYDAYGGSDYYGNEGYDEDYYGYGAGGGYGDNYGGGYDDYDYYGGGSMGATGGGYGLAGAPGASRGRARGARGVSSLASVSMARGGRGSVPIRAMRGLGVGGRGAPRGLMSGGGGVRGAPNARRPFGGGRGSNGGGMSTSRGVVAPRGIKRKAASDFNQSESKKAFTQDSWTTQPIAQQPLGQQTGYSTAGDSEWYQDSFAGGAQWE